MKVIDINVTGGKRRGGREWHNAVTFGSNAPQQFNGNVVVNNAK